MLVGSLFLVPLIGASYLPATKEKWCRSRTPLNREKRKRSGKGSAKAEEILLDRKHVDTVQYTLEREIR